MINGDPEGLIFLSYPHANNGFFFLLTTGFYFKISFQKSPNMPWCNFTWRRHFNIAMTSLDDHVREFQYNQCMKSSGDSLGKIAWVRWDFLSRGKIWDILIRCARIWSPFVGQCFEFGPVGTVSVFNGFILFFVLAQVPIFGLHLNLLCIFWLYLFKSF